MIKALIVEDEAQSREMLIHMVHKNCPALMVVASAAGVQEAAMAIEKYQPELIFLDISMPDGTGFDLLEKLSPVKFDIIFTTATDKYAVKAIKYSALDYLLKPIDPEELKTSVNRLIEKKSKLNTVENLGQLLQNLKQSTDNYHKITIPGGTAYDIVYVKDIIRCEADGSYTLFYLSDGRKLLATHSMKYYEDILPKDEFMRVHNSHLIALKHVKRFVKQDGGVLVMSDGAEIEIARRKKDDVLKALDFER